MTESAEPLALPTGQRRLKFEGTPNFRDLGGYRTADGREVKWGYLFRSGQLSELSTADLATLAGLSLELVCDFRRVEEQERDPSLLPVPGPGVASIPIEPGSNDRALSASDQWDLVDRAAMFEFMVEINRNFALGQRQAYAEMFQRVLALEQGRMLFHCAAGKDRTGFAAAAILLALGVPRETVMEDYLLTREYFLPEHELGRLQRKYEMGLPGEAMMPILEVHPDYLQAAFDAIDEEFSSFEHYLEDYLGLTPDQREQLCERYLVAV